MHYCTIAKDNRLFGGLWYGITKPDMTLFLKPLVQSLSKLYCDGKRGFNGTILLFWNYLPVYEYSVLYRCSGVSAEHLIHVMLHLCVPILTGEINSINLLHAHVISRQEHY